MNSKQSKQSNRSRQSKQNNQSEQGKRGAQSNRSVQSKQSVQNKQSAQSKQNAQSKQSSQGTRNKDSKQSVQSTQNQHGMRSKERGQSQYQGRAGGQNDPASHGAAVPAKSHTKKEAPIQPNQRVELDIIGMNHNAEGVGRTEGFTLFVDGALPGERVSATVSYVKKQYGYAELKTIMEPSADRTEPPCPIYEDCGGCQLQHMNFQAQLNWKRQLVVDNLMRIGKLQVAGEPLMQEGAVDEGIIVHPTIGTDDPWRYRNKAQVPIGHDEAGQVIAGFYARGSHRIVDMDACLIQHEENDEAVRVVKQIAQKLGISTYNEQSGKGLLRHVMVRTGFVTGEMMIVLITNGKKLPQQDEWIEQICESLPQVTSIVQNVNDRNTNVIFGDDTKVLWGSEVIFDELDGIRFAISARSFYQVNPVQTIALYRKAVEYAGLSGTENVIDAYCGIGTISLFLARQAGKVYGVEIVPEAIEDAARNAELNGITNATFEAGAAEIVIPRWRKEGIVADVIVVDPPRKGCDQALLDTIIQMQPERVVYVSCNPSTLARDLRVLVDGGYVVKEAMPVDMFPWTGHVESVVRLSREKV